MDIEEIISKQLSFQPNAWSTIEKEISLGKVIKDIKMGKYSNEVNRLRWLLRNGEKEKYDIHKKRLPGVTFCANFRGNRKKELIKKYHNLVVLDIDKLDTDELERIKIILRRDKYVFTFWTSPSEKGLKGIIYLKFRFDYDKHGVNMAHKWAFEQVTDYFMSQYSIELDICGSDTTRLCFFSYDPGLIFKTIINPFYVNECKAVVTSLFEHSRKEQPNDKENIRHYVSSKDLLMNPMGKNNQRDRKTIDKIIKYLNNKNLSITGTYDEWYRIAYAISSSFTHDIGEKYFLKLCELDEEDHDEIQSKNMLLYCYQNNQGTINFSTITFMAKNKGFNL